MKIKKNTKISGGYTNLPPGLNKLLIKYNIMKKD